MSAPATITVLYFASLRDAAGVDSEQVDAAGRDLRALYGALRERHGFVLPEDRMRVAVDGAFARWEDRPGDGAEVAFIPPVSGG
jgi:molybdopterin synthase sulfur carrier subunit